MHRSGGRKPAVVAVATPQRRSTRHSHLVIVPGNSSGGRQPAVVLETYLHTRFRNCSADCRRCVGARRCNRVLATTRGLRPPLLIARVSVHRKSRNSVGKRSRSIRSGGREAAVARKRQLQRRRRDCSADCRPCVSERRCKRVVATTGGLRPPLLVSRRSSADGIATFEMHKRTRTRRAGVSPPWLRYRLRNNDSPDIRTSPSRPGSGAAGVSPPWFWRRTCTRASAIVRQTADRCVGARRCNRDRVITGGLRPPLLVSRASGGAVRTCAESSWQARFPNHGGLTPPALGPAGVRASQKSQFLR